MGRAPINLPRVTFRFPDDLRDRLEAAAKAHQRSVNAEVVARLEASFETANDPAGRQWVLDFVRAEIEKAVEAITAGGVEIGGKSR